MGEQQFDRKRFLKKLFEDNVRGRYKLLIQHYDDEGIYKKLKHNHDAFITYIEMDLKISFDDKKTNFNRDSFRSALNQYNQKDIKK